jgi:hypothetical protein
MQASLSLALSQKKSCVPDQQQIPLGLHEAQASPILQDTFLPKWKVSGGKTHRWLIVSIVLVHQLYSNVIGKLKRILRGSCSANFDISLPFKLRIVETKLREQLAANAKWWLTAGVKDDSARNQIAR